MNIEPFEFVSKKGNTVKCFKLTIGKYQTLVFTRSQFEYDYIKEYLEENFDNED